jgi:uncharacterized protein (TIGR00288 family)
MAKSVAVFVDGENISAKHAPEIMQIAKHHGPVNVCRVYGNAVLLPRWAEVPGYRLIHSGTGKNAADMLLAIEALELVITEGISTVIIASSDQDFIHLVTRLRERGVTVIGVGEVKTPSMFRAVCQEFELVGGEEPQQKPTAQACKLAGISDLDLKIRKIIAAGSTKGEGVRINILGTMHAKHGIKISTLPERTWRKYLSARPNLYDLDPPGPDAKVRFKAQAFG